MGRPVARNLEDEMMTKIKALFDRILDTVNKENPQYTFDFEQFVDCFDENDHFTKRVFEFLVKETAQRYRSAHPQPQQSSHPRTTIHHLPGLDSHSATGATASTSNASASGGVGTGAGTEGAGGAAAGGGETTVVTSAPSATTLRQHHHHHHHHSPFQSSRHSLPPLERDSLARSPSTLAGFGSMSENAQATAPSANSSGAALRYLLSSQGFGQNSRRSRMAQRMLSNDLLAFHQGQPSLLSSLSALSSPVLGTDAMLASASRGPTSTAATARRLGQDMDISLPNSSAPLTGSSSSAAGGSFASTSAPGSTPTLSSPSRVRSPFEQMQDRQDRLRRYMPLREFSMELMPETFRSTDSNATGSSFLLSDDPEPTSDPTVARASSSSQRRRVIVAENMRQAREQQIRQMYAQTLRARQPPAHPSTTSQTQPSSSQASSSSSSSEPSQQFQQQLHQQVQEQRARRQYDQLRQLEQSQHAHQQALQALQGQRVVAPEDTQQLSFSSSQQDAQSTNRSLPQDQIRYVLQDNGLRLVQPYPGSPGTPVPLSSGASDSTSTSLGTGPLTSQSVLDEAYQEFSSSTERGRAAMRNALAADLHIEEDHQVLLTGEVSRRRRRRVVGRFSNSMGSPDIGSDNSSAIISQQQQQQEQQQQRDQESSGQSLELLTVTPTDPASPMLPTSSTTVPQGHNTEQQQQQQQQQQRGTGSASDAESPSGTSIATPSVTATVLATTALTVPEVSVEMVDSQTTRDDAAQHGNNEADSSSNNNGTSGHLGLGLTSTGSTNHGQSVPPTPPSPNPNRNPMPTFQDRRRSSINPADIETLVREMEANAQSAALGIRTTGISSSNRPTSSSPPRIRFPLHVLSPIAEPGGSTPPVALVPPLGILTPNTSSSSLAGPTGSRATQQPVLLSPEPEHGSEHISGPRSPPLQ